jgi:hypothetical protein
MNIGLEVKITGLNDWLFFTKVLSHITDTESGR